MSSYGWPRPRVLPREAAPTLITNLRLGTDAIDEWYGITASFEWTPEGKARWEALPSEPTSRTHPDGTAWRAAYERHREALVAFVRVIAHEVLASPLAHAYYAKPRKVTVLCDGGGGDGGGERTMTIPVFLADEFSDWGFSDRGGWIAAAER